MADIRFVTYDNKVLLSAGVGMNGVSGTKGADVLIGSTGNDTFISNGGADTMTGGAGNDTYVISHSEAKIVEQVGGGIDTIKTIANYVMPNNIENMFVTGYTGKSGTTAIGNAGANAIIGDQYAQTIDGRGGNDVLTGGGGRDTFLFQRGSGNDVITDFGVGNGGDFINLQDYSFRSFDELRAAMAQVGSDVVLKLSPTDSVTFRNVQAEDLVSENVKLALDLTDMKLTFKDEFSAQTVSTFDQTSKAGTWQTEFGFGGIGTKASHYIGNYTGEQNIFVDAKYGGKEKTALGINPFSVKNGVLTLRAEETPDAAKAALWNIPYTSGLLTTKGTFAQTYGYFEIRAQLPSTEGAWPAFWLLPANGGNPPEIDVFEARGGEPGVMHESVHDKSLGPTKSAGGSSYTPTAQTEFHTYGVKWDKDYLTYYTDGRETWKIETPSSMHQPMYLVVSMAVGSWGGTPANNFKADLLVDYVRAYSLADPASPPQPATPTTPMPTPVTSVVATAAAIVASLSSYAENTALTSIKVSDGGSLVLSLAQRDQFDAVLGKVVSSGGIVIADTAVKIAADFAKIGADAKITKVSVSSGGFVELKASQLTNTSALVKLGAQAIALADTAANVVAALDVIEATGVARIILTDAAPVAIASQTALAVLIKSHPKSFAAMDDGLQFSVTNATAANSTILIYDVNAKLISSQSTNWVKGVLQSEVIKNADGSARTTLYANNAVSSITKVASDGSREVDIVNIKGKSYVSEESFYSASGNLLSTVRKHADGTLDYRYKMDDGKRMVEFFDAKGRPTTSTSTAADGSTDTLVYKNGILNLSTHVEADKSKDVYFYNIENRSYVSEHNEYDTTGMLIRTERVHTDGSLDYRYTFKDGNKTTELFTTEGVIKSKSVSGSDGLIDAYTYVDGILRSESLTFADKSRDVRTFDKDGKEVVQTNHFGATGKLEFVETVGTDGVHRTSIFAAGAKVTSHESAVDVFQSFSGGRDTFIFNGNFGKDVINNFDAGPGSNHDVIQIDRNLATDFDQLTILVSGRDTVIDLGHGNTVTLVGINAASLDAHDFLFA